MATESTNYIDGLDKNRPAGAEPVGEADDHLNLIKKVLKNTFRGDIGGGDVYDGSVNVGPDFLNGLPAAISDIEGNYVKTNVDQIITAFHKFSSSLVIPNNTYLLGEHTSGADRTMLGYDSSNQLQVGYTLSPIVLNAFNWDVTIRNQSAVSQDVLHTGNIETTIEDYVKDLILNTAFPPGSIYYTAGNFSPALWLGGTWMRIAQGRFLVGEGTDSVAGIGRTYNQQEDLAGRYVTFLTIAQMPSHKHQYRKSRKKYDSGGNINAMLDDGVSQTHETDNTGGGEFHENSPPAYGLYVWQRVS